MWIRTGSDPWQLLLFSVAIYTTYACIWHNPNHLYIPSNRQARIYYSLLANIERFKNLETRHHPINSSDKSNKTFINSENYEKNSDHNMQTNLQFKTSEVKYVEKVFRQKRQALSKAESGLEESSTGDEVVANSVSKNQGDAIAKAGNHNLNGSALARSFAKGTGISKARAHATQDGGHATALSKAKVSDASAAALTRGDGNAYAASQAEGNGSSIASSLAHGNGSSKAEAMSEDGSAIATAVRGSEHVFQYDDNPKINNQSDKRLQKADIFDDPFFEEFPQNGKPMNRSSQFDDEFFDQRSNQSHSEITIVTSNDDGKARVKTVIMGRRKGKDVPKPEEGSNDLTTESSRKFNLLKLLKPIKPQQRDFVFIGLEDELPTSTTELSEPAVPFKMAGRAMGGEPPEIESETTTETISATEFISTARPRFSLHSTDRSNLPSEKPTQDLVGLEGHSTTTELSEPVVPFKMGGRALDGAPEIESEETTEGVLKDKLENSSSANSRDLGKMETEHSQVISTTEATTLKTSSKPPNGNAISSSLTHKDGNAISHANNPNEGGNAMARSVAYGSGFSNATADVGDSGNATALAKSKENNSTSHAITGDDGTALAKSLSEGAGHSVASSHATGNGTSQAEATVHEGTAVATAVFGGTHKIHEGPFDDDVFVEPSPSTYANPIFDSEPQSTTQRVQSTTLLIAATSKAPKQTTKAPFYSITQRSRVFTEAPFYPKAQMSQVFTEKPKSKQDLSPNGKAVARSFGHNSGNAIAHANNPNDGGIALARSSALCTGYGIATADAGVGGNATALARARENNSTAFAISGTDGAAAFRSFSEGSGVAVASSKSKDNGTSTAEAIASDGDAVAISVIENPTSITGTTTEIPSRVRTTTLLMKTNKFLKQTTKEPFYSIAQRSRYFTETPFYSKSMMSQYFTNSPNSKQDLPPNGKVIASSLTHKSGNAISHANNPNDGGIALARSAALGTGLSKATADTGDGGNATALAKTHEKNSTATAISGSDGVAVSRSFSEGSGTVVAASKSRDNGTSMAQAASSDGDAVALAVIEDPSEIVETTTETKPVLPTTEIPFRVREPQTTTPRVQSKSQKQITKEPFYTIRQRSRYFTETPFYSISQMSRVFTEKPKSKQDLPPNGKSIASSLSHKTGNAISHANNPNDGGLAMARSSATGTGFSDASANASDGGNAAALAKSEKNNATSYAISGSDGTALSRSFSEVSGAAVASSQSKNNGSSMAEATANKGDAVAVASFGEKDLEQDSFFTLPTSTEFSSSSEAPEQTKAFKIGGRSMGGAQPEIKSEEATSTTKPKFTLHSIDENNSSSEKPIPVIIAIGKTRRHLSQLQLNFHQRQKTRSK